MSDPKGQKTPIRGTTASRTPSATMLGRGDQPNLRSPTRKSSIDPSKDKLAYFKDNIQDPDQEEDFDPNVYYYHRGDKEPMDHPHYMGSGMNPQMMQGRQAGPSPSDLKTPPHTKQKMGLAGSGGGGGSSSSSSGGGGGVQPSPVRYSNVGQGINNNMPNLMSRSPAPMSSSGGMPPGININRMSQQNIGQNMGMPPPARGGLNVSQTSITTRTSTPPSGLPPSSLPPPLHPSMTSSHPPPSMPSSGSMDNLRIAQQQMSGSGNRIAPNIQMMGGGGGGGGGMMSTVMPPGVGMMNVVHNPNFGQQQQQQQQQQQHMITNRMKTVESQKNNATLMMNDRDSVDSTNFDTNSDFPALGSRVNKPGMSQEYTVNNEEFPALAGYKDTDKPDNYADSYQQQPAFANKSTLSQSGGYNQHHPVPTSPHRGGGGGGGGLGSSYDGFSTQNAQPTSPMPQQQHNNSSSNNQQQQQQQMQQRHMQSPIKTNSQTAPTIPAPSPSTTSSSTPNSSSQPVASADAYGLMGLLNVIRMSDQDLNTLALGEDLTDLGLNLNSPDSLYTNFSSPFSNGQSRRETEFFLPLCYYTSPPMQPATLKLALFSEETLFYVFYSMPKDALQMHVAAELYSRDWRYHKEHKIWFTRVVGAEPTQKTGTYERGSYFYFDPNTWEKTRKDNFVLYYDQLETAVKQV